VKTRLREDSATASAPRRTKLVTPPKKCDGCSKQFNQEDAISDIRTWSGQWGYFCEDCVPRWSFDPHNPYGMGMGQRYVYSNDGWYKVKG